MNACSLTSSLAEASSASVSEGKTSCVPAASSERYSLVRLLTGKSPSADKLRLAGPGSGQLASVCDHRGTLISRAFGAEQPERSERNKAALACAVRMFP